MDLIGCEQGMRDLDLDISMREVVWHFGLEELAEICLILVPKGVKLTSDSYIELLKNKRCAMKQKKRMIFMHDYALPHAPKYIDNHLINSGFKINHQIGQQFYL